MKTMPQGKSLVKELLEQMAAARAAWVYSLLTLTTYRQLGAAARSKRPTAWQRHPRRWTLQTVLDAFRQELATHPDFFLASLSILAKLA